MASSTELTTEQIREFVLAGHGNLARVKEMLAETPALLNAAYQWRDDDYETALQAAAHVGNRAIAEYLLAQGAPLDICTAAMLGRQAEVERFVADDPAQIDAAGAHGISLLTHAALSGDLALVRWLYGHGARAGISAALYNAVSLGNAELVRWLLQNGEPDLSWKNYEGKTALVVATERGLEPIAQLLREHGATEA
ncbi:MAG TPA: ankyrin repeat domain-containing protein [Roseiflexaceae bacterium]|nr:ankyrin repeat domain-containing protein [Roseiflexaceae bacterium]